MKKANTELVLDNKEVPAILEILDKELTELKAITDKPWKTSGILDLGTGATIAIKTETKVENLVKALSSIIGRKHFYDQAQKLLELKEVPEFSLNGTLESWVEDIKLRLAIVQYEERKNKLQEFKDKMSKFLSEDDQKKVLLNEMISYLKK